MTDPHGAFVVITLLAAATSLIVAVLALRRRHVPGATAFCIMMFAGAFWCAAYAGELLSTGYTEKELWAKAAYFGIVVVPPSWLLFCLGYTGKLQRGNLSRPAVLFVVPALTLVFALLGTNAGLVWSSASMTAIHGVDTLVVTHGPWFWVHTAYSYGCLLLGSLVLLTTVLTEVRALTAQGVTIVLAVVMPWVANIVTLVYLQPRTGLDLTPPSIVLSGALVALGLSRFGVLHVFPGMVPVARDAVMQGMRDGVLVVGRDGVILSANRAADLLLNAEPGHLEGRRVTDVIPDAAAAEAAADESGAACLEYSFETALADGNGEELIAEIVVSRLGADPRSPGVVMAMRDVTQRRRLEEQLKHRAHHDELTGLPNRSLLREHLRELLALQKRDGRSLALLMLDLDRFKEVNDTFGHGSGDQVLCTMAQRLRRVLRDSDLVARLGGDEFAIVLPGCDAATALLVAAKIRDRVSEPLTVQQSKISVAASVGIAVGPDQGRDDSALMQHADVALYLAKEAPQGIAMYDADLDPNSPDRLETMSDLRTAVESGMLRLHYQPIVRATDGEVVRVEALARWPRSARSVMEACDFVPLAEQCGLLGEIGSWALDEAVRQCRLWEDAGWRTTVAVNLAAPDLQDPELVERVAATLSRWDLEPERLWVELTETSIMVHAERAREVLHALRDIGVGISIDDFGVGHSSLAYVRTLPAGELKIDRSFVRGMATQSEDKAIVRAAVTLGHDLGLSVTAEGTENASCLNGLIQLGCDHVQGYCIAPPMPPDQLLAWVRGHLTASTPPAPAATVSLG